MIEDYDSSWDLEESEEGNLPQDEDKFDKKYTEWEKRSWESWLRSNLKFPFSVKRMEDEDDAYFTDITKSEPFKKLFNKKPKQKIDMLESIASWEISPPSDPVELFKNLNIITPKNLKMYFEDVYDNDA